MRYTLFTALLALTALPAAAHIVATPDTGKAGSYFQTSLRVSHGCDGSPTTAVTVKIPDGVLSVHPQAKPGWKVTLLKHPLDPAMAHAMGGSHGKMAMDAVTEVTWTGRLPDDQYDEFGLLMKLPDGAGQTLWFPTVQTCAKGESRWVEIPREGQAWHDVPKPAPFVTVIAP